MQPHLYGSVLLRLVLLGEQRSGGTMIVTDARRLPSAVVARGIRMVQLKGKERRGKQ